MQEEELISQLHQHLLARSSTLPKAKEVTNKIIQFIRGYVPERTGYLWIYVTLLNSGKTDGLVKDIGYLELINEEKRIPIRINEVMKVEKRSVEYARFWIDEGQTKHDDLLTLKNLVKGAYPSPVVIELQDIRGKEIRSKRYTLPTSS